MCGTWQSRWGPAFVAGELTVRKADVPSGRRMTREANAGGRKTAGNHDVMTRLPLVVVITGRIEAAASARKGADAGRVNL